MKTLAAILVETGRPLELVELGLPALRPGQVLVELAFSGVCHTQLLETRGHRGPDRFLPHCLGHEGSGTVLETGPGVTKAKPGDQVVLSWLKGSGATVVGTRYDWDGRAVNAGPVTTFQRHAVVSDSRLTVLPEGFPLATAALVGCAVPTGVGVVFNTAAARPGQSIAVFGAGGVGLCAIAAARAAGCDPIIAVDILPAKLDIARAMGATHGVDASSGDAVAAIKAICPAGLDIAIESSGRPPVMAQSLAAVRPQGGLAAVVGNAHAGETLTIDPQQLNQGKRLLGTWGGDSDPDRDYARYCRLLSAGKIDIAPLLSTPYPLERINDALDDLESGRTARPLIGMASV